MTKIIRTPTRATGGITEEERVRLKAHADLWISRAMRTTPVDVAEITSAIHDLYAAANLKRPRVVVVPSPLVMAFAYGASAAIWYERKTRDATHAAAEAATRAATDAAARDATRDATYAATYAATRDATDDATRAATNDATDAATNDATYDATYAATRAATYAATRAATHSATYDATYDATNDATRDATYAATDAATRAATYAATYAETRAATDAATRAATDAATYAATRAATDAATRPATHSATYAATHAAAEAATRDATDAATRDATRDATHAAAEAATRAATDDATRAETRAATDDATRDATRDATYAATRDATDDATRAETDDAARACFALAGRLGLMCANRWGAVYQGGAYWSGYDCFISAFRDVLGLQLPKYDAYASWERAAIAAPFRVMHEEFCLVSDFPEVLRVDDRNLPHCADGPSHRWRDGWELYHWHGTLIPSEWIRDKAITPEIALKWEHAEQRRAACEILGYEHILTALDCTVIDDDGDPEIGVLVEVTLDGQRERFLRVRCGTGRDFALPVPPDMQTALAAQAWTWGLDQKTFSKPEVRT